MPAVPHPSPADPDPAHAPVPPAAPAPPGRPRTARRSRRRLTVAVVSSLALVVAVLVPALASAAPGPQQQAAGAAAAAAAAPVRLILDTDIEEDVDDVGVVDMLHGMADGGEVELLGMMVNTPGRWGAPALDALNTYHGRPNIPVGTLKPTTDTTRSLYNRQLAEEYPNDLRDGRQAPDAVALYRKLLAREADGSVVIASVGLLTNLANLLRSGPDASSPLNGTDLVARKVRLLSVMGGAWPGGNEFNFQQDAASAATVVADWPARLLYSGFEIGDTVLTGSRLFTETPFTNPSRRAYQLYVGEGNSRSSWDQTAAYVAVRGTDGLFGESSPGQGRVDAGNGSNSWTASAGGRQTYLTTAASDADVARAIEDLMVRTPPVTNPAGELVRGIAMNGPAVTVEGAQWSSWSDALASGLTVGPGVNLATNDRAPRPSVAPGVGTMLRGEIWRTGDIALKQTLADGDYQVYLWVMEDYRDNYRAFDVRLEGRQAVTVRTGRVGEWSRYGPLDVSVTGGALDLDLVRLQGDTLLQGLAIYRGFTAGVNLGGPAATVGGNAWASYADALGSGLTVTGGGVPVNTATNTVAPAPAVDAGLAGVLRTEVWASGDMALRRPLPDGDYEVSLWVLEDYRDGYHAFDVRLEGDLATTVATGPVGSWQRYGPLPVTVSDGALDVDLVRLRGDTLLQGLSISRQGLG